MSGMRLTIVGCSGSYPGPESPASCYLVEADDENGRTWRIVVDMGNGSLGVLQRFADPLKIDAVLLSHLHADHCVDMTSYYVMRKWHPTGAQPPIPVFGPKGTGRRLAQAYDLPKRPGMREEFIFTTYGGPAELGPFRITPTPVEHPVEAFGLRIEANGKVLAYSGDTAETDVLLDIAADADLFLCEAAYRDGVENPPGVHITGVHAGTYATKARARKLVITHVPPWHDSADALREARSAYEGPTELAATGAVYDL